MDREFVLRKLSVLLHWDEARDAAEFPWLRLMSRLKFDGYQDFLAGARFLESLVDWLQQFRDEHRGIAYDFVRSRLVYIGPAEMQHLVESFFPETVRPHLVRVVAEQLKIHPYEVWSKAESREAYCKLRRKTLFIELSDGARIDIFRRANAGVISNEQIYTAPRINKDKWLDMRKELRDELGNAALFSVVYLVDDFAGSGTSLIRCKDGRWKGKLVRFWDDINELGVENYFEEGWTLCVHHYMATDQATRVITEREAERRKTDTHGPWFPQQVDFSYGTELPADLPLLASSQHRFLDLVAEYYNPDVEAKKHNDEGGSEEIRNGYSGCRLPLVLDHNTPNNSFALIWAESTGGSGHQIRPLFRRRQRHT